MPTRSTNSPKLRHYKPKDLAVVRIDGKDYYLGKYGSPESLERYHRILAERAASPGSIPVVADAGRNPTTTTPTVVEVMEGFWENAKTYYRRPDGTPTEELESLKLALRPLRALYGLTPAREFGPLSLKAVRQSMIDRGLAQTTVNYRIGKVVRVFRWAVENELVPASTHHALTAVAGLRKGRTIAPEPSPIRPVANADVDAVKPFVTRQIWAMIELQRWTAARPGEIVIMRTGDIDRVADEWIYRPSRHKTEHHGIDRRIFLGPNARMVVEPWLRSDPAAYLFQPCEAVESRNVNRKAGRKTPMTPSQRARKPKARPGRPPGSCYSKNAYRTAIWRGCDRAFPHPTLAKIKKADLTPEQQSELLAWQKAHRWHPNQLRHTAATMIRTRFGLEAAQVILGHSHADVTQVYAEWDSAKAREVMKVIG